MLTQPQAIRRTLPALLRRCATALFWGVMLAGHLPAMLRVVGGEVDWVRGAALLLSQLFFLLKLIDVPWLRLPRAGRARLAIFAAVALLHADVVHRAAQDNGILAVEPWHLALVVGGTAGAIDRRRILRHLRRLATLLATARRDGERTLAWLAALADHNPSPTLLLIRANAPNRAPPRR